MDIGPGYATEICGGADDVNPARDATWVRNVHNMTVEAPTLGNEAEVSWISPARGLWVATHHGEHAGMIERVDGTYQARDARGSELGSFEDLDGARDAIDGGEVDLESNVRRVTTLLWAVNVVAAVVAVGLAFVLLR